MTTGGVRNGRRDSRYMRYARLHNRNVNSDSGEDKMSRLIDADKLVELIDDDIAAHKDGYFEDFELPPTAYGSLCALRMVREYIKALPTVEAVPEEQYQRMVQTVASLTEEVGKMIEAEPIRHGRWSENTYGYRKCSECEVAIRVEECMGEPIYNYCPNCGARMDGGENE